MAKMKRNPATATIVGLKDDAGRTMVTIEYPEPQPVDVPEGTTTKRFTTDWFTISCTWAAAADDRVTAGDSISDTERMKQIEAELQGIEREGRRDGATRSDPD